MDRIKKVNNLIRGEVSKIIRKEVDLPKVLITITRVKCSSNLIEAKVYISVMPEEKGKKVFSLLQEKIYEIQQRLNKRLEMRPVPKIKFVKDKGLKKAAEIEKILKEIKEGENKR